MLGHSTGISSPSVFLGHSISRTPSFRSLTLMALTLPYLLQYGTSRIMQTGSSVRRDRFLTPSAWQGSISKTSPVRFRLDLFFNEYGRYRARFCSLTTGIFQRLMFHLPHRVPRLPGPSFLTLPTTDKKFSCIWNIQGIRSIYCNLVVLQWVLCRPHRFSLHSHKLSPSSRSPSLNLPGFLYPFPNPFL